jgi:quercetin dioxygenase-like cupin family protein
MKAGYARLIGVSLMFLSCWQGREIAAQETAEVKSQQTADTHVRESAGPSYTDPKTKTTVTFLLDRDMGAREAEVAIVILPAGAVSPAHKHRSAEIFYVLDGRIAEVTEGKTTTFSTGGVIYVPPNTDTVHKAVGDKPVKVLAIWVPAGEQDRYEKKWIKTK